MKSSEDTFREKWVKYNSYEAHPELQLYLSEDEQSLVHNAMDGYAKEVAIEFAVWMDLNGYTLIHGYWESLSDLKGKTSEQLFDKFISETITIK